MGTGTAGTARPDLSRPLAALLPGSGLHGRDTTDAAGHPSGKGRAKPPLHPASGSDAPAQPTTYGAAVAAIQSVLDRLPPSMRGRLLSELSLREERAFLLRTPDTVPNLLRLLDVEVTLARTRGRT